MDQAPERTQWKMGRGLAGWLLGLAFLVVLYLVLGRFDNTTELLPGHPGVDQACIAITISGGLISAAVSIFGSRGLPIWRRIGIALSFGFLALLLFFMVSYRASSIIEGWIDFLPGKTQTHRALLLISRAYQTHGKGRSWNIQTTPIWSDLDVTEDDYDFVLAHRRPGDVSVNPDEISSKGYFCALVTVQRSGKALRIMHAGSEKLPKGAVIICPSSQDN